MYSNKKEKNAINNIRCFLTNKEKFEDTFNTKFDKYFDLITGFKTNLFDKEIDLYKHNAAAKELIEKIKKESINES